MIANEVPLDGRAAGLTKERLLVVAGELFADRGFDSVSKNDHRSGKCKSAVNYHLDQRKSLLVQLLMILLGR